MYLYTNKQRSKYEMDKDLVMFRYFFCFANVEFECNAGIGIAGELRKSNTEVWETRIKPSSW